MGTETAMFVRRNDRVCFEMDGQTITDVSLDEHIRLLQRGAAVLGMAVVPLDCPRDEPTVYWLDEAPTFGHYGDTFTCRLVADDREFCFQGPGELLAVGMGNAARVYAKAIRGNIIAFRRRRKRLPH